LQLRSGGAVTHLGNTAVSSACLLLGGTATATYTVRLAFTSLFAGAANGIEAELYRGGTLCAQVNSEIGLESPESGALLALLDDWRASFFYGVWSFSTSPGVFGYFDT